MSQRFGRAALALSALIAVTACVCPWETLAAQRSIQRSPGPPPRGTHTIVIDVRPSERHPDDEGISLREHALMSQDARILFEVEPDSIKTSVDENSRLVYFEILTLAPAENIKLTIMPAFTMEVVGEMPYAKPRGVTKTYFHWRLTDSTGVRVPPGYYMVGADGRAGYSYGLVRVRRYR